MPTPTMSKTIVDGFRSIRSDNVECHEDTILRLGWKVAEKCIHEVGAVPVYVVDTVSVFVGG